MVLLLVFLAFSPPLYAGDSTHEHTRNRTFANRTPQWSPDGSTIVVNIGSEIYAVSVDGDRFLKIPDDNGKDHHFSPSLSPDGRVAYANYYYNDGLFSVLDTGHHKRDIRSANIDGTDAKQIFSIGKGTMGIYDPVWSPEGSRIAFRTINSIWTMARDGSDAHPIESLKNPRRPIWSNDGQRIAAVERERMGTNDYRYSISNVKWDGTDKKIVVELQERGVSLVGPVWSHTDDLIYFIKREKADLSEFWRGGNFAPSPGGDKVLFVRSGIYVIDTDGTGIRLIARIRPYDRAPSLSESWSQDGKRIAVANNSATPKAPVILFTMAPDGSDIRVLLKLDEDGTPQPGHGEPPSHTNKLYPDVESCQQSETSTPTACAPRDVSKLDMPTHTPMPRSASTPKTRLIPPAPLNLTAISTLTATSTVVSVSLTWDAPHDDAEVTGYQILRRAEQDQEFKTLNADTGSTKNEYIDTDDTQPGTVYEYRVRAINSHGVGPPSEPVRIIVPQNP